VAAARGNLKDTVLILYLSVRDSACDTDFQVKGQGVPQPLTALHNASFRVEVFCPGNGNDEGIIDDDFSACICLHAELCNYTITRKAYFWWHVDVFFFSFYVLSLELRV